ncbi:cyclic nucleotide-binding domain-containing protein [Flammeovirga aprica]|uniref:Crp/Fnr family transcriptional regulator n=1 Tax=Flammeovirga aprica JL-4 TaxID=694437 RepID=A0A7X9RU57_9BACT|nr:Crp/Fnr family transcriptional regulator [Flammeovirga aprica JL-4]
MLQFISHCAKYINITIEDVAVINKIFLSQKTTKNTHLLQNEKHNKCFYFIEKGSVKLVSKSSNRKEEFFFQKGDFFSTYHIMQTKSQVFDIVFLEDTHYIEIPLENLFKLFDHNIKFKKLQEIMLFKREKKFEEINS